MVSDKEFEEYEKDYLKRLEEKKNSDEPSETIKQGSIIESKPKPSIGKHYAEYIKQRRLNEKNDPECWNTPKRSKEEDELFFKYLYLQSKLNHIPKNEIENEAYENHVQEKIANDSQQYEGEETENEYDTEDEYENSGNENESTSWHEDIQERISNNEAALEELREYRQEIEDDREGGLYENMHDMYEADRTDEKISDREDRINELNELLDEENESFDEEDEY